MDTTKKKRKVVSKYKPGLSDAELDKQRKDDNRKRQRWYLTLVLFSAAVFVVGLVVSVTVPGPQAEAIGGSFALAGSMFAALWLLDWHSKRRLDRSINKIVDRQRARKKKQHYARVRKARKEGREVV